jgi:hypothetical protein
MEKNGLRYLACEGESVKECLSELAPLRQPLRLRYHKGSERTGKAYGIDCRLWDVLSPKLEGYVYTSDSHIPTLSVEGMKERGLLKWF